MTDVPHIRKELNMRKRDVLKLVSQYGNYDAPILEEDILEVAEACHMLNRKAEKQRHPRGVTAMKTVSTASVEETRCSSF